MPFPLYDGPTSTVKTDRGEMLLAGVSPHRIHSTLIRLSDGTIMGLCNGNKEILKYKTAAGNRKQGTKGLSARGIALAGFSRDNLRTWEYVVIADPDDYGVVFQEADMVRLDSGRLLAIYGNSEYFWPTYSDDEGRTWAPMKQLAFYGDCPSMIKLSGDVLLAAFRNLQEVEEEALGVGLVASGDGGETWDVLGNIID